MKKALKSILTLALCATALLFVACEGDEEEEEIEYVCGAGYTIRDIEDDEDGEKAALQKEFVEKALADAGLAVDKEFPLSIKAADKESAKKKLLEKMDKVKEAIENASVEITAKVEVKGVEKQYAAAENDRKHPVELWYSKEFGPAENDSFYTGWLWDVSGLSIDESEYHFCRWVREIRSEEYFNAKPYDSAYGDNFIAFGGDANAGAGGDYIWLFLEHSGKRDKTAHRFEWEDKYAKTYITDVVAIYGGAPETVTISGRTYRRQKRVADLNKKAEGEWIYLYATTDPVPGYEGYYLNTGSSRWKTSRTLSQYASFSAKDYLKEPCVVGGHRFVERVVQAYKTDGSYVDEMDANKGAGGRYIKMILTYATKNGGY